MANKEIMDLLELAIAQPSSTAVGSSVPQGDFYQNQPISENLANQVGSIDDVGYIEAGVPSWLADITSGGSTKLLKALGKLLSKRKFPIGYGYPTRTMANITLPKENAHSAINNLIDANELQKITKKVETSSYIPDMFNKLRTAPDPNLSKIILRNDPRKLRK